MLGPSGSGKTTLLNLIGALDHPDRGEIVIAGRRSRGRRSGDLAKFRRESVSFVFQTFNLFPALTAIENVQFGVNVTKRPQLHPGRGRDARTGSVSVIGSGTSPIALGRRTTASRDRARPRHRQPVLLADEPTGELDFRTGLQILELLHEQADTGPRSSSSPTTGRSPRRRPRHRTRAAAHRRRWSTRRRSGRHRKSALVSASSACSDCAGRGGTSGPDGCKWRRSRSSSASVREPIRG